MQKRVLSRMVWHKTCTFCIHSKKIFSARRLTRHTVQEGTSLGPRIQRLDINHRMIILTLDNDPQMTGYVPWISVTRWGTETELSGFAMFSHGSHNAWLKCQGHSANWTLARQKWVAGYLLGYSLKFVWYIHVYTINIYSHASPQIKSTWYTWCIHIFIIIWICERDIPKSYLCTTSVMIYQNESALTLFLLLSITSVMASSKKLDQNLVPDHCLSTIIGCNYTHYFSYLLHFSNHTSGNDILFVIRTIIDHSLPIYKWFPQLWTEPSIYRWILQF